MDDKIADHNPVNAINALVNIMRSMDSLIQVLHRDTDKADLIQALTYARNSLFISADLWKDDLTRRLGKSRGDVYIFSMTEDEKVAFCRRVAPGMRFAAEELRRLIQTEARLAPSRHVPEIIESLAITAEHYAASNKESLRVLLTSPETQDTIFKPLPLQVLLPRRAAI